MGVFGRKKIREITLEVSLNLNLDESGQGNALICHNTGGMYIY